MRVRLKSQPMFLTTPLPPSNLSPHGFFSAFRNILAAIYIYEQKMDCYAGLEIDFEDNGLYYDPLLGKNSWNYYFSTLAYWDTTMRAT